MADDRIKPAVVAALVKDGWTITHDPYPLVIGDEGLSIDLGAERAVVAAERGPERIAVEIKSFLGPSVMTDFYSALGQFLSYQAGMAELDPGRRLVVAVGERAFAELTGRRFIQLALARNPVPFVVVRLAAEEVDRWTG